MEELHCAQEFSQLKSMLRQGKIGSYLIIPLKYEEGEVDEDWLARTCRRRRIATTDLTETVKAMLNEGEGEPVGACYELARTVLLEQLFGTQLPGAHGFAVRDEDGTEGEFDWCNSYLYLFHTRVAFLCLGLTFSKIETLDRICRLGYAENGVAYRCLDADGGVRSFSLDKRVLDLCGRAGLRSFFPDSRLLLEAYVYTVAVVSQRFRTLEALKQVTFNLHQRSPLDTLAEDGSEEDVRYVYALKDQTRGSYRWGCCVSSQTISYAVADEGMDLAEEMETQAQDGLPLVLTALYEKYTCLRFTQLIAAVDKKRMKELRALKRLLLEFRAYGTVDPANLSRWHNVKRIYQAVIETNGVPAAIEDISHKLNILVEHQQEIETARNDTVAWVLTLFGVVSILASILSIVQILSGGDLMVWFTTIMSSLVILLPVVVVVLLRRKGG